MVRFQTRLMAAAFVLTDVVSTNLAWILAYFLRFHSDLVSAYLPYLSNAFKYGRPPLRVVDGTER